MKNLSLNSPRGAFSTDFPQTHPTLSSKETDIQLETRMMADEMKRFLNQKRKQENLHHPMFKREEPSMFYDHSNTVKMEVEWSLRKEHMLIICLSLHGTARCDEIAEYSLFEGYE